MKRLNNVFDKVIDMNNLKLAHKMARKGKTNYKEVKKIDKNEEYYLGKIQDMLLNKTYEVSDYVMFKKYDSGKIREIYKLPYFPDRIIQWALMLQIEDMFLHNFIYDTYSSIPNRGIHLGLKRVTKALKDVDNTKYCLKLDIHHFYPSINHAKLKDKLNRKIKDKNVMWLLNLIIDSIEGEYGVPIGNYTSQYFGNFFLSDLDHYVKEILKVKYYFRYCDDIVIFADSKEEIWEIWEKILKFITDEDLIVKENYQVFPVDSRGVDFLGYRSFHGFVLLRKSIVKSIKKAKRSKFWERAKCSYIGWIKWCNSYRLALKHEIYI